MNNEESAAGNRAGTNETDCTTPAATQQKRRREYVKHGDVRRKCLLWREGIDAIDGRTRAGKEAKTWRRNVLKRKGGRQCPIELKQTIDLGTFYLWRALCLRSYIVADAIKRGTPINKRRAKLPANNDQHDTLMEKWKKIDDELKGGQDLARRLMAER
jgi:hypothetical protein